MELIENSNAKKLLRAKKRVENLKGFYTHLTVYLFINTMVSSTIIISALNGSDFFGGSPFNVGTFASWFFWGIGLAFHAIKVFGAFSFFGKEWEERKIEEYLNNEE